ncbi:MAG: tRNA (N6-isopentenyl adenosine(37)-C2)-methylthiotransferase MiaB [Rickettsiales bacterium]|nr:tRNA (N6-isopentenyl adenosine(37)-C2)-methylthiotransferase MiaB [Rickettsiales bacterium]
MVQKIYIKTYGCQMNIYDSERIQDLMAMSGYQYTDSIEEANLLVINTCHIREKASEKLFSELGRVKVHKEAMQKKGEQMIVAVAGCVAQAEGKEIFKRAPIVDIIVGPESYQTLPDLVGKLLREKSKQINLEFDANHKFDNIFHKSDSTKFSSFLTIQEGCDKFCTFCVVPYTRGAEYSKNYQQIVNDANILSSQGAKEIYLLGQNVNAYHFECLEAKNKEFNQKTNFDLADLIKEIAKIKNIERIRYTTSHPADMNDSLINAHRDIEKLMPFLHLPVQAGSNQILKAMNRKHSREDYFKIIEKLRKVRPDMGLSSDFIVGFPGETDQDFKQTLDLVEKIGFAQCYSFKYSPRPGTPAHDDNNQVPENIKEERLAELQALLTRQQIAFNKSFENKRMKVLFEKEAPKSNKLSAENKPQIWGKSPWLQSVVVDLPLDADIRNYIGKIIDVKIIKSRPSSLFAELC